MKDVTGQFVFTSTSLFMLDGADFGTLEAKGSTYNISNVHVHAPSEHYIDGKRYDLEMHIFGSTTSG